MIPLCSEDELLDLVDEQDRATGSKLRSEIYREGLSNFRAVNAFLVNDAGQLWIPRRTATKRTFPSCLDMSVAGHVSAGEDYLTAFRRELHEELNLELDDVEWNFIRHLTPLLHGVSCFMRVYEIRYNQVPCFNREDFAGSYWLYPHEVLDKLNNGDNSKNDLPKLVKLLYLTF